MVERIRRYTPKKIFKDFKVSIFSPSQMFLSEELKRRLEDFRRDIEEEIRDPNSEVRRDIRKEFEDIYIPRKHSVNFVLPGVGTAIVSFSISIPLLERARVTSSLH